MGLAHGGAWRVEFPNVEFPKRRPLLGSTSRASEDREPGFLRFVALLKRLVCVLIVCAFRFLFFLG